MLDSRDYPVLASIKDLTTSQQAAVSFLARYTGNTYKLYKYYLGRYFDWCSENQLDPINDIRRLHVELYIRSMIEVPLCSSTVVTAMSPVRGFYKFAYLDGVIDRDPATHTRLPKVIRESKPPFDRDDMRRFLRAASDLGPRHLALTHLLMVMGLRISEACSIDIPQIYNTEQGYRVLRYIGKGSKPAATPIPYQSIQILEAATEGRMTGPLIRKKGLEDRLSRCGASGLIDTVGKRAGFTRRINPHLLRAAAITLGLDSGLDLREMQDFARHEDPRTTRRHYDLNRNNLSTHAAHTIGARLAI